MLTSYQTSSPENTDICGVTLQQTVRLKETSLLSVQTEITYPELLFCLNVRSGLSPLRREDVHINNLRPLRVVTHAVLSQCFRLFIISHSSTPSPTITVLPSPRPLSAPEVTYWIRPGVSLFVLTQLQGICKYTKDRTTSKKKTNKIENLDNVQASFVSIVCCLVME